MKLYYKIKNIIRDFRYDFRCRCQRFVRGYAYGDIWDMDMWFIETIQPMLIHLRDHGCGIANELYNEEDDSRESWENVLTEMINCLDMMDVRKVTKKYSLGRSHDDYKFRNKIMEENKNRFFELFNKYFYSLWD